MIDNFDLNNLPRVKFSELEKLPHHSGIYFVVDCHQRLLYVGKAQNINQRWLNHHRYDQLEKINQQNSIDLKWYECENNDEILTQLENYFIATLYPELNQTKVESKPVNPAEIALRKTLIKISKYVAIYGYEVNSKVFSLPTVFLKYDLLQHNPARILKQIFDADNRRKSNLRWSYYRKLKSTPIWHTKCNGIAIVIGCDYNANYYLQNGDPTKLAGVSLINLSAADYEQAIASKDWSQSYHPHIQRYTEDLIPLLWSNNQSFPDLDHETIKKLNQERTKSKIGKGRSRGRQVKVYCEAIGQERFVIKAYHEAIEWFGGYDTLGLQKADYISEKRDAAPKWFKPHKVTVRIPEKDSFRSLSAPISATNMNEVEQRLEKIRKISSLHQKVKFKR
ncbi:MAG: GIY-YIG nuclease family protein [Cyanobacteria bacterium J06621_8]